MAEGVYMVSQQAARARPEQCCLPATTNDNEDGSFFHQCRERARPQRESFVLISHICPSHVHVPGVARVCAWRGSAV